MDFKFTKRIYYVKAPQVEDFRHLCEIDWFAHIGEGNDISKAQAAEGLMTIAWEEFALARNNDMTRPLVTGHANAFGEWNVITKGYTAWMQEAVYPRLFKAIQKQGLKQDIYSKLRWLLLAYMQEETYSQFDIPRFFDRIVDEFQDGRLPFAWEGNYPQGELVVL